VARRISRRLPPNVSTGDLIGAGSLGLVDSVCRRKGTDEGSFASYTRIRIRGAIFDELRNLDWSPRRSHAAQEERDTAARRPVAVVRFDDMPGSAANALVDPRSEEDPLETLARRRDLSELERLLEALPGRERVVLKLYYFRGMGLREIGLFLGITEARVSQLHHRALARLRPQINSAA
jgi:RNA polymerase sigma factor for flagellar operon FliA